MLTQIGNCYKRLNNIELAKRYYQKAIDIDPLAITAIRQLRIIFVENEEYFKAYELWRVDNLIDENTNGTIIEKSRKIQNSVIDCIDNSKDCDALISLGDSYYSAALYDDAAIIYKKALELDSSYSNIDKKIKLINDYLNVLEEYKKNKF